jgi:hypothetical protein
LKRDQHPNKSMPAVPARACVGEHLARQRTEPERIVQLPVCDQSGKVITDPRKWSISRRSKSSLRTSPIDSPVGFAMGAVLIRSRITY